MPSGIYKRIKKRGGWKLSEETKKKIGLASSIRQKGKKISEYHIKKLKEAWLKRKINPNYKPYWLGKKRPNLSTNHLNLYKFKKGHSITKGIKRTNKFKEKISNTMKGRKPYQMTKEIRKKMSLSRIGKSPWNKGKKWSNDMKIKLSEAQIKKGRPPVASDGSGGKWNLSPRWKRTYDGILYHSKMECDYAKYLDTLIKRKEILKWERQSPLEIIVNKKIISRYFCDFKVFFLDGHFEYHEIKGYSTDLYLLKKKLVEVLYNIKIKEIKSKQMKNLGLI